MLATDPPNGGKGDWMRRLLIQEASTRHGATPYEIERALIRDDICKRNAEEEFKKRAMSTYVRMQKSTQAPTDGHYHFLYEAPPFANQNEPEASNLMKQMLCQHEARHVHTQWQLTQINDSLSRDLLQPSPSNDPDLSPTTQGNEISKWGDDIYSIDSPHRELEEVD